MNPEIHEELRKLTAFQHWLGTNYKTLPTDSGEMTKRAILYNNTVAKTDTTFKTNKIMKLTGKSKEKFIFWMCQNHEYARWYEFEKMPESCQNALMIEFFDSVGIYISIINTKYLHQFILEDDFKNYHQRNNDSISRDEATNAAIEKANSLFNSK